MNEETQSSDGMDWTYRETRVRQSRAGLNMTAAERLAWLEEMLDELLPLVGRARPREQRHLEAQKQRS